MSETGFLPVLALQRHHGVILFTSPRYSFDFVFDRLTQFRLLVLDKIIQQPTSLQETSKHTLSPSNCLKAIDTTLSLGTVDPPIGLQGFKPTDLTGTGQTPEALHNVQHSAPCS